VWRKSPILAGRIALDEEECPLLAIQVKRGFDKAIDQQTFLRGLRLFSSRQSQSPLFCSPVDYS